MEHINVSLRPLAVALDTIEIDPNNARSHPTENIEALKASLSQFGQRKPIVVNKLTNQIEAGNGTYEAAKQLGWTHIAAVFVEDDPMTAKKFALSDNRTAELAQWDYQKLIDQLKEFETSNFDLPPGWGAMDLESISMNLMVSDDSLVAGEERDNLDLVKPAKRTLPIDAIYTYSPYDVTSFAANSMGWGVGVQSTMGGLLVSRHKWDWRFQLTFIDNEWKGYDHKQHIDIVAQFTPKYATVRDIMTREQCKASGIEYYPLEKILKWAEEMEAHAKNVIVIPKYDCIKDIPEKYVLGYSVLSTYGATPVPAEKFRGRRVHLLGGSWRRQLAYINLLGDDVVSFDNNWIAKVGEYGGFVLPDGKMNDLRSVGMNVWKHKDICIMLSLGHITTALMEIGTPITAPTEDEFGFIERNDPEILKVDEDEG